MRLLSALLFAFVASLAAAAEKPVIDLWPGPAPGEAGKLGEEKFLDPNPKDKAPVSRLTNITKPTLTVFRPEKPNGACVVIAPGGGYNILAWNLEGTEIAEWFNSIGVTACVLKYRVPRRPEAPKGEPPLVALHDAQRAISLVRSKAKEWDIDPAKVGMLGFSAGGHLTAWTSTNSDKRSYEAIDDADKQSCRPDFVMLIYPAYLVDKKNSEALAAEIRVSKDTPPTFFAHAYDDGISPENSVRMFLELKKLKVPAELHVYSTGGHGFGMRTSDKPASTWPARCEEWLRTSKVIPAK